MAGKKLATYVHVDGQVYGPDDDVPADVVKQITNPAAWGKESDATEPEPAKKAAPSKSGS